MGSRLLNAPIVLDNGSGTIRAGFAGQDLPKCYFPSYVAVPSMSELLLELWRVTSSSDRGHKS